MIKQKTAPKGCIQTIKIKRVVQRPTQGIALANKLEKEQRIVYNY